MFDNVILLGRENIKEHSESLANLYNGSSDSEKYEYKLVIDLNPIMDQLSLENTYLKKLCDNFNIPMDTYESIYYGNGLKNKEIKLDYNILDTKNKLRQFYDDKKLI
jgi:formyltetrahydrofolate synthetase